MRSPPHREGHPQTPTLSGAPPTGRPLRIPLVEPTWDLEARQVLMETQVGPLMLKDPGFVPPSGPCRPEAWHHDAAKVWNGHPGPPLRYGSPGQGVEGWLVWGNVEGQPPGEAFRKAGKRRKTLQELLDPAGPEGIGASESHGDTGALDPLEGGFSGHLFLGESQLLGG